ncbi:hypothetical protein ABMA09_06635 [Erwinia rhapontici]|nr:hypothetical protein [Erwinia rhapontici]MCS3609334.1 hypothetical protein [Erwinia rhapontici]TDS97401.1 hypothetical protein EDF84_10724 [Erwinia rhapontici]
MPRPNGSYLQESGMPDPEDYFLMFDEKSR